MTKEEALKIIFQCATKYKENLVGKNLLFLCVNSEMKVNSFETIFTGGNFLHMIGVKFINVPKISPNAFYSLCI